MRRVPQVIRAREGAIGVVVHPRRPVDNAVGAIREWAASEDRPMGQIPVDGQDRRVADPIDVDGCGLIVAVGGDGTVLAALHAAAQRDVPVFGVACGSLGALTSVKASDIVDALRRVSAGEAEGRPLPALVVRRDGEVVGEAFNDLAVVRRGGGQVIVDADVDGAQYATFAGDGVVVATPLGSSAYTLAAGGPLIVADDVLVMTPLAPHAGFIPPLVASASMPVSLTVDGGWGGARLELDGKVIERTGGDEAPRFAIELSLRPGAVTLLDLDGETLIGGLRRRGVITDSPRVGARAARERRSGG